MTPADHLIRDTSTTVAEPVWRPQSDTTAFHKRIVLRDAALAVT